MRTYPYPSSWLKLKPWFPLFFGTSYQNTCGFNFGKGGSTLFGFILLSVAHIHSCQCADECFTDFSSFTCSFFCQKKACFAHSQIEFCPSTRKCSTHSFYSSNTLSTQSRKIVWKKTKNICIYIYVCIYIYAVKLLTGPRLAILIVTNWATLIVTNWATSFSHYKNRGFRWFFGCSVISLCFFCFQLFFSYLKIAFFKKGVQKLFFFNFLCFKLIFWKFSFLG